MNGLEAIKAMMEGRLVARWIYFGGGRVIYKIIDGNVFSKCSDHDEGEYSVEDDFDFDEEYHEYKDPELFKGWERVNDKETFYSVGACRGVIDEQENTLGVNVLLYNNANYFLTKEKAEEIDFKQTLFRKLQRFSDENGGSEIDWNNYECDKYYIFYNHNRSELEISTACFFIDFGQVYFETEEIAEQAIELFKEDLIKYYTHDWSKGE